MKSRFGVLGFVVGVFISMSVALEARVPGRYTIYVWVVGGWIGAGLVAGIVAGLVADLRRPRIKR